MSIADDDLSAQYKRDVSQAETLVQPRDETVADRRRRRPPPTNGAAGLCSGPATPLISAAEPPERRHTKSPPTERFQRFCGPYSAVPLPKNEPLGYESKWQRQHAGHSFNLSRGKDRDIALINSKCTTYGNMRTQQKQEAIGPAHPIRAFQAGLRFA